ncbi:MAG: alpha/beta hydrolase [Opitutae bacterium]|nr:alpha/beta hydrolase [Opitutae bacterium]
MKDKLLLFLLCAGDMMAQNINTHAGQQTNRTPVEFRIASQLPAAPDLATAQFYVEKLPTALPNGSTFRGIVYSLNDLDQVMGITGFNFVTQVSAPVIWSSSGAHMAAVIDHYRTSANSAGLLNNFSQVAINKYGSLPEGTVFSFTETGGLVLERTLPGINLYGINDAGWLLGIEPSLADYTPYGSSYYGRHFVRTGTGDINFELPPGTRNGAFFYGVNFSGEAAGSSMAINDNGSRALFGGSNAKTHWLATNGSFEEAYSLNNAQQIVGTTSLPDYSSVPAYWENRAAGITVLPSIRLPDGYEYAWANKINRWGHIVGKTRAGGALWVNKQQINFAGRLINPDNLTIGNLRDINDRGVMLGDQVGAQSQNGAPSFRLRPVWLQLAVDANRDGQIKFSNTGTVNSTDASDVTSADKLYRFWVNDDIDRQHAVDGDDSEEDDLQTSPNGKLDWQNNNIPSKRDLEDFARIQLSVAGLADSLKPKTDGSADLYLGLKWVNGMGTPAIKLYRQIETDGGLGYLTDETAANEQINTVYCIADVRDAATQPQNVTNVLVEGSSVFILPPSLFSSLSTGNAQARLLFEGCKPGAGQLQLVILRKEGANYTEIGGGGGVWIDLKNIDEFYERWTVGDTNGGVPWASASRKKVQLSASGYATGHSEGFAYGANAPEGNKYLLYVHGWNLPPWEKNRFAETAFKRLYWQGYKGRFGVFCWPTTYGFENDQDAILDGTNYDRGEWAAWRAATPLRDLLLSLHDAYGDQVYIVAHSMGNVVTGEALELAARQNAGTLVNTYVASQAAIPAHVYDGGRAEDIAAVFGFWTNIGRFFDGSAFPQTPNVYPDWLAGNGAVVGRRVNFYNENDYALWHDVWELNQYFKPDRVDQPDQPFDYSFVGDPQTGDPDAFRKKDIATMQTTALQLGTRADVMDRYEIMSFAAEARSKAVGAATVLPNFNPVNLQSIWPADDQSVKLHDGLDYSAHKWHSAQFRSTNMRQRVYWQTLLGPIGFRIITAP